MPASRPPASVAETESTSVPTRPPTGARRPSGSKVTRPPSLPCSVPVKVSLAVPPPLETEAEADEIQNLKMAAIHWASAARVRAIFRDAFASAEVPYFNPHSFRNTLVRFGQTVCLILPGGVQGVEPEPWPRRGPDDLSALGPSCNLRQGEII